MKTVLFVSNFGTFFGGGEVSLFQLMRGLDSSQFASVLICPERGEFCSRAESSQIPVQVVRMPSLKGLGLFSLPSSVWKLLSLIKKQEIEIIHANGSRCMIYAGLSGKLSGVPVIWHVRATDTDPLLDRFLALLSDRIIVNSRSVLKRFSFFKEPARIALVYNGVDLKKFNPSVSGENIRREYSIGRDEKVITIIGRLDGFKGHRYLLEAAKRVLDGSRQVRFLIVGDGVVRDKLEILAKDLEVAGSVVFCGQKHNVPEFLAASDVVVSASLKESFGRVIVEAMAMAKPVVATNVGGVPEIVQDGKTGILVEPADCDGLASAIISVMDSAETAFKLADEGQKRVRENFSLENHIREIEEIYNTLCVGRDL
jgi:glycosyltransferase involved in cell wall biosynthesis